MKGVVVGSPRSLPDDKLVAAAQAAIQVNPLNRAPVKRLARVMPCVEPTRERLAVVATNDSTDSQLAS